MTRRPVGSPLRERAHHRAHSRRPGHVRLHPDLHVRRLQRQAAGVEGDALADQHHVPGVPRSLRLPAQLHQPRGPNRPRPDCHQTTEALPGQISLVPHADREAGRGRDLLCPVGHPRRILDVGRGVDHDPSGQGGAGMLLPCRDGPLADCDVADRQAHARGRGRWRRARPRGGGRAQEEALGERPDRRHVQPAGGQDEDVVGPAHPTGGGSRRAANLRGGTGAQAQRKHRGRRLTLQVDPDGLRSCAGGMRAAQPAGEVDAPLREELDDRRVDPHGLVRTGRGLDADDDHARPRWGTR